MWTQRLAEEEERSASNTNPVVRPGCSFSAVGPDVVILVVRVSGPAQVEPAVLVTGVIGDEVHDHL